MSTISSELSKNILRMIDDAGLSDFHNDNSNDDDGSWQSIYSDIELEFFFDYRYSNGEIEVKCSPSTSKMVLKGLDSVSVLEIVSQWIEVIKNEQEIIADEENQYFSSGIGGFEIEIQETIRLNGLSDLEYDVDDEIENEFGIIQAFVKSTVDFEIGFHYISSEKGYDISCYPLISKTKLTDLDLNGVRSAFNQWIDEVIRMRERSNLDED
jgi:hypothetical protein